MPPQKILRIEDQRSIKYRRWRSTFETFEKIYLHSPATAKYEVAFFRLRKAGYAEDVLFIPVEIKDERIASGKLQFLVIPAGSPATGSKLGKRWVDRKALIMKHDINFADLAGLLQQGGEE